MSMNACAAVCCTRGAGGACGKCSAAHRLQGVTHRSLVTWERLTLCLSSRRTSTRATTACRPGPAAGIGTLLPRCHTPSKTPLHKATYNGHAAVVALLVANLAIRDML